MDPNEALRILRATTAHLDRITRTLTASVLYQNAETVSAVNELTDALKSFDDLDKWLTKGGFPPSAWPTRPT